MVFYDLSKEERNRLVEKINQEIFEDLSQGERGDLIRYFSDEDTYIRKTAYLAIGKIFYAKPQLQLVIFSVLEGLSNDCCVIKMFHTICEFFSKRKSVFTY